MLFLCPLLQLPNLHESRRCWLCLATKKTHGETSVPLKVGETFRMFLADHWRKQPSENHVVNKETLSNQVVSVSMIFFETSRANTAFFLGVCWSFAGFDSLKSCRTLLPWQSWQAWHGMIQPFQVNVLTWKASNLFPLVTSQYHITWGHISGESKTDVEENMSYKLSKEQWTKVGDVFPEKKRLPVTFNKHAGFWRPC